MTDHKMIQELLGRLRQAHDFFTAHVPLIDQHGFQLDGVWSWGPTKTIIKKAEQRLAQTNGALSLSVQQITTTEQQ